MAMPGSPTRRRQIVRLALSQTRIGGVKVPGPRFPAKQAVMRLIATSGTAYPWILSRATATETLRWMVIEVWGCEMASCGVCWPSFMVSRWL